MGRFSEGVFVGDKGGNSSGKSAASRVNLVDASNSTGQIPWGNSELTPTVLESSGQGKPANASRPFNSNSELSSARALGDGGMRQTSQPSQQSIARVEPATETAQVSNRPEQPQAVLVDRSPTSSISQPSFLQPIIAAVQLVESRPATNIISIKDATPVTSRIVEQQRVDIMPKSEIETRRPELPRFELPRVEITKGDVTKALTEKCPSPNAPAKAFFQGYEAPSAKPTDRVVAIEKPNTSMIRFGEHAGVVHTKEHQSESERIAIKTEAGKQEVTGQVMARHDASKADGSKLECARPEGTRSEVGKFEVTKSEHTKPDLAKTEITKVELTKSELAKSDLTKSEIVRTEVTKSEIAKPEITKSDITKSEATKHETTKSDSIRQANIRDQVIREVKETEMGKLHGKGKFNILDGEATESKATRKADRQMALRQIDKRIDELLERHTKISEKTHSGKLANPEIRKALADLIKQFLNGEVPTKNCKNPNEVIRAIRELGPDKLKQLQTLLETRPPNKKFYEGIDPQKAREYHRFLEVIFKNYTPQEPPKSRIEQIKDILADQVDRARHIVQQGQNLITIAWKYFNDRKVWPVIAQVNGFPTTTDKTGKPTYEPKPGQVVLLPKQNEIRSFRQEERKQEQESNVIPAAEKFAIVQCKLCGKTHTNRAKCEMVLRTKISSKPKFCQLVANKP